MNRIRHWVGCGVAGLGLLGTWSSAEDLHPQADTHPVSLDAVYNNRPVKDSLNLSLPSRTAGLPVTVQLKPSEGTWDCSFKLWVVIRVENKGRQPLLAVGRIAAAGSPEWAQSKGGVEIPAGETGLLPILLSRKISTADAQRVIQCLGDIRGFPGGHQHTQWRQMDASAVNRLFIDFYTEESKVNCELSGLQAAVDFHIPSEEELKTKYTPCADRFGQSLSSEWSKKIQSAADLKNRLAEEDAWLSAHPDLPDRDIYGGWAAGEQQSATGHFHTLKKGGRWWLVDPDGNLFWSFGVNGLNYELGGTRTPGIWQKLKKTPAGEPGPDRLPSLKGDNWNPYQANLLRKFGADWKTVGAERAHRRLHAWGMNTLGNWSSEDFYALRRTPYVIAIHYARPTLDGPTTKYGDSLPDVFHPEFREKTVARMKEETVSSVDPWCIGYFIDNELSFSNPTTPAYKTLNASADCSTRKEFLRRLKNKYSTLTALNGAWNTAFADWDALAPLKRKATPDYQEDLREFSEAYLRTYYSTCRDAVRSAAPQKLYLGSRINHVKNQLALSICAEYADVVSVNLYDYTPDVLRFPPGFDAPVMIGEFHFGTITERGMWGAGLATGADIRHASSLMGSYLRSAIRNPLIVGAHWFKYSDQPLTGRSDGENYRIGFVDVSDTPYPEMADEARSVMADLYSLRSGK